jgi:CRISPR-associated protein Cas10/Cmr2 subtype III-B
MLAAGFTEDDIKNFASHVHQLAATADFLPFPSPDILNCSFDGVSSPFHHPLGDSELKFNEKLTEVSGIEGKGSIQPIVDGDDWQQRFFAHWRMWEKLARNKDYRLGFLPADARIPDNTIWSHMGIVSALAACARDDASGTLKPAFVRFQLGPVQEFIAQARSTRDLWSGSYLLSWLMAAGLKALSAEAGPESVIFPNLRGQPLFDFHWKEELWDKVTLNGKRGWSHLGLDEESVLTPNLPNVFLAVVPAVRATELAQIVSTAIQAEWAQIADACWQFCREKGMFVDEQMRSRYQRQVDAFAFISWQATPWPETLDKARTAVDGLPFAEELGKRFDEMTHIASQIIPFEQRDDTNFLDPQTRERLDNVGLTWSLMYALNSWQLDGVRQVRDFKGWSVGGWTSGKENTKDYFNGRDEAVFQGKLENQDRWSRLFNKGDALGAVSLIKRTWHIAYLEEKRHLDLSKFPMGNTRSIAAHEPDEDTSDEESAGLNEKYFAVLAFDGDEIGKWISGEKCPTFGDQFANYGDGKGSRPYFEKLGAETLLKTRRLVSPSYHLQFSDALANFSLRCAGRIVKAFDGRLIYAGGDDVLALLPADDVFECANALQKAFRGEPVHVPHANPRLAVNLLQAAPGFLYFEGTDGPFIVPGPNASASAGVCIAHFKHSLQDVVREAQKAERRAKHMLGRSAIALTLCKRSGEISEWGCKWSSGGLELLSTIGAKIETAALAAKFPHRVCELLEHYLTVRSGLSRQVDALSTQEIAEVIRREFCSAVERQSQNSTVSENEKDLLGLLDRYLSSFCPLGAHTAAYHGSSDAIEAMIGLCTTAAFAHRTS